MVWNCQRACRLSYWEMAFFQQAKSVSGTIVDQVPANIEQAGSFHIQYGMGTPELLEKGLGSFLHPYTPSCAAVATANIKTRPERHLERATLWPVARRATR